MSTQIDGTSWTCWSMSSLLKNGDAAPVHMQGENGKTLCGIQTDPITWEFMVDRPDAEPSCARCLAKMKRHKSIY